MTLCPSAAGRRGGSGAQPRCGKEWRRTRLHAVLAVFRWGESWRLTGFGVSVGARLGDSFRSVVGATALVRGWQDRV